MKLGSAAFCDVAPGDGGTPAVHLADEDGWLAQRAEGNIDLYVFAHGHDFPGALRDFYDLTGPQPLLPRYALGNWWSRYHPYS